MAQGQMIACQGTVGAYSQLAASGLFPGGTFIYFKNFAAVARAVKAGMCSRGVLPIENNTWGSVREVYQTLRKEEIFIAGGCRMKIRHELLGKSGMRLSDVKAVYSHEQALGQCSEFLHTLGDKVRQIPCLNTAVAARMVSESSEEGAAAIASPECAGLYGLTVIKRNIADSDHNYTRFVVVAPECEITEEASRLSVMLTVSHEPGSLARVLGRIAEKNLNLLKIESVPIPGEDFEFLFYLDIEGNAGDPAVREVLGALEDMCPFYRFLGNYREINL